MAGRKTGGSRGQKANTYLHGSRAEAIGKILDNLEAQLMSKDGAKGTVADYLRLIQAMNEMGGQRPGEIEITWVNSLREGKDR